MKVASLIAAGVLALSAGTALADGMMSAPVSMGYADREADWSGLFVSASIGYGWANTDLDVTSTPTGGGATVPFSGTGDNEGVIGAVGLGYDMSMGNDLIFGVFGDFTFGEIDDSFVDSGGIALRSSYDDVWSVGARAGYVVNRDTLLYGTIGYTNAEFTISNSEGRLQDDLDGYFVGAGLERKLCDNLFLKAEYRYANYDDTSAFETVTPAVPPGSCGGASCDVRTNIEHDMHTVRVGLAYKFGGRRETAMVPLK